MKENLPVVRKKSLLDKIKAIFSKKELKEDNQEIIQETVKDSYLEREKKKSNDNGTLYHSVPKFNIRLCEKQACLPRNRA